MSKCTSDDICCLEKASKYTTAMMEVANEKRSKKIAGIYRVNEPINNFKLRVRIVQQRPLPAELFGNTENPRDPNFLEEEDHIFSWQEKVFSPYEINLYNDETNCLTDSQKIYHQRIKDDEVQGSRLYTYTENDLYYSTNELLTKPCKTKLAIRNETALPTLQNRKPFRERYNKAVVDYIPDDTRIRRNHYLYTERSVMYVMVDLSQCDKILTHSDQDMETLLCVIAYDRFHQILSVDPNFTNDDSYTVTNSSGIKFNYWIEHVSEKPSSLELQQQQNESRRIVKERLIHREAEMFHGFQLVAPNVYRFFIKLDIISAHDFQFDGLFISYHFDLPDNWSTNEKEKLYGRTQRCNLNNYNTHFSYTTEISLDFNSDNVLHMDNILPSWPRLLFSVESVDNWCRHRTEGYAALPLPVLPGFYKYQVSTWRPAGSVINSLRRIFTGGTYVLEDITYCSIPKGHDNKILNKSLFNVTSSGSIKLSINMTYQTHSSMKDNDHLDYIQKLSTDKLMDNVENIFEQFKAARERSNSN